MSYKVPIIGCAVNGQCIVMLDELKALEAEVERLTEQLKFMIDQWEDPCTDCELIFEGVECAGEVEYGCRCSIKDARVNDERISELEAQVKRLKDTLSSLYALVIGECPSLLDEDSWGDATLDERIRAALVKEEED